MTYSDRSFCSHLQVPSGELLLIRHGITDMAGTLCGQSDPPLNEEGRRQAKALASLLRSTPVCRLYCSDLQRAVQTALPLAEVWNIGGISRKGLREISFGDWEGQRWADIRPTLPAAHRLDSSPQLCARGGEIFAAFRDRVLRAFQEIIADSSGVCTAVVTHLGVIRVVLSEFARSGQHCIPEKRIDYCAVYRVNPGNRSSELLTISAPSDASAPLLTGLE